MSEYTRPVGVGDVIVVLLKVTFVCSCLMYGALFALLIRCVV